MLNANISNIFVKSMNLLKEFDYQDIKVHSCQSNFTMFYLTGPGLEPTINVLKSSTPNHYATDAVLLQDD
jgi:hypothetical protein